MRLITSVRSLRQVLFVGVVVMLAATVSTHAQNSIRFGDPAGLLLVQVKPASVTDFEKALSTLQQALANSKDETRRKQAAGWKFYRASELTGENVLYVFVHDPVVPGADYQIKPVLDAELPQEQAQRAYMQYASGVATIAMLNLKPLQPGVPLAPIAVPAPAPAPASTAAAGGPGDPPSAAAASAGIRAKCAAEWPDDFNMRVFCEGKQNGALTKLHGRNMTVSADHVTIRRKCASEWADDYNMRDFCEEKQLTALSSLRSR